MASEFTKEELNKTFIEVRKAYRILYSYQKQVLNLINYIGKFFGWQLIEIAPRFAESPTKIKSDFDFNAWRWLGMYEQDFIFSDSKIKKNMIITINLMSDSGWYQASEDARNADDLGDNLSTFVSEDKSKTLICISIVKNWGDEISEKYDRIFLRAYKEDKIHYISKNDTFFFVIIPLSSFINKNETDKILREILKKSNQVGFKIQAKHEKF